MTARKKPARALALLSLSALLLVGCDVFGGDDDDDDFNVDVSLEEFSVTTSHATAPDGPIVFHVTNDGTVVHEFVVVQTALAADALPALVDGSYMENGPGTTVIDEAEDIAPGVTVDLVVDLDEGHYVLICNRVVGGMSHYAMGMRTGFTVD